MNTSRFQPGKAKRSLLSLIFFITCILQAPNAAAVVIYDEAINGDLSDVEFASTVGPLSNGINTVLGSSFFERLGTRNNSPFTWERDHFTFSLSDTATVSFLFTAINVVTTGTAVPGIDFRIFDETRTASPANPGFITPLITGSTQFIAPIVLTAGSYEVFAEAAGVGFGLFGRFDWDYSWDMTVTGLPASPASIPEPASLALLCFGLAGIGFSRKSIN